MNKYHQPAEIIGKLRETEIFLSKGVKMDAVLRKIGVTEQTYYRWRKRYGGMKLVGRWVTGLNLWTQRIKPGFSLR